MLNSKQAFAQACGRSGFNGSKAEKKKIMTQSTFSRKSRNPDLFTVSELQKLDKALHFSDEEIIALIKR